MIHTLKAPFAAAALAALALAGGPAFAQDAVQAPADNPPQQGERLDREGHEGREARKGRAGKDRMRHGRGQRGMFGRAAEFIGLTDEQKTRIDEIHKADGEALKAAHTAMAEKRRALDEAVAADPANQATIDARILELSSAQTEMMRLSTSTRLKVMQVLTAEQRTKLRESRESRDAHRMRFKR